MSGGASGAAGRRAGRLPRLPEAGDAVVDQRLVHVEVEELDLASAICSSAWP